MRYQLTFFPNIIVLSIDKSARVIFNQVPKVPKSLRQFALS